MSNWVPKNVNVLDAGYPFWWTGPTPEFQVEWQTLVPGWLQTRPTYQLTRAYAAMLGLPVALLGGELIWENTIPESYQGCWERMDYPAAKKVAARLIWC